MRLDCSIGVPCCLDFGRESSIDSHKGRDFAEGISVEETDHKGLLNGSDAIDFNRNELNMYLDRELKKLGRM